MAAANRISRLAVYGQTVPSKPTRLVRLLGRRSHDANDVRSDGSYAAYLPFSIRGALYGTWTFPVDAEYEFRLRIANFRPDPVRRRGVRTKVAHAEDGAQSAHPPRKLVLAVDGAAIISDVVEGSASFGYSRGEFVAKARIKAGDHFLRASYPELADMDDPLVSGTFTSRERTSVTGTSVLARADLAGFGWLRLALNQRRESFDSGGVIRDVTEEHAQLEGEGDGTLASWRATHWPYYHRELDGTRYTPAEDMPVVCQYFEVVFPGA
jgi:hypothetical protein